MFLVPWFTSCHPISRMSPKDWKNTCNDDDDDDDDDRGNGGHVEGDDYDDDGIDNDDVEDNGDNYNGGKGSPVQGC